MRLISWIKRNKLSSLLLGLILIYLIWNYLTGSAVRPIYPPLPPQAGMPQYSSYSPSSRGSSELYLGNQNRMVQKESNLSLLVSNVRDTAGAVVKKAEDLGGFMIQSNFSNPGEASNATVSVRVPSSSLNNYLNDLRKLSLRVVSENLSGNDITDQYTDIQARLATLNATKAKFEAIFDKASAIQDILDVQNKIIEIQAQIDNLKGQQQYMEKNTKNARITVYLSTDELALPYAPDVSWRPSVVFKNAVRSLIGTLRGVASALIWIGVYAVIWAPILIVSLLLIRKNKKKESRIIS